VNCDLDCKLWKRIANAKNVLKSHHGTWKHNFTGNFNMAEKIEGEKKLVSLPLARIKTIMKSSPDMSHAGQESIFMVAKATVSESLICTSSSVKY
jgi:hypothetical protein